MLSDQLDASWQLGTRFRDKLNSQEVLYIAPEDAELEYRWNVENGTIVSGTLDDTLTVRWETMGNGEVAAWALNIYACSSDTTTIQLSIGSQWC
jgi:hypothetical protein